MAASDWSERTRMLVTIAVGVVVNAGLGFWFYTANSTFKQLEVQYSKKQTERAELKKVVEIEGPILLTRLNTLKSELHNKESKLPEFDDVEKLVDEMAKIAESTGATRISSVRVSGTDTVSGPGANYARTTWKTRWKADFMSWCKLLNAMEERFPRFISFENLTITPKNSGLVPTGSQHDIQVDVVTYRYIPRT